MPRYVCSKCKRVLWVPKKRLERPDGDPDKRKCIYCDFGTMYKDDDTGGA